MDSKIILDAIGSHLDLMSSLQIWMLVTAIATIAMAVDKGEELDLKILKAKRHNAAILVMALQLILMLAVFLILFRLYGLLKFLPQDQIASAFTTISTHSSLFNPFAYFGESPVYWLLAWAPLVGILIAWALIFASTAVLSSRFRRLEAALGSGFFALSIVTFFAIQRVYLLLVERTSLSNPVLSATLESLKSERAAILGWGGLGALVAGFVVVGVVEWRERGKEGPV